MATRTAAQPWEWSLRGGLPAGSAGHATATAADGAGWPHVHRLPHVQGLLPVGASAGGSSGGHGAAGGSALPSWANLDAFDDIDAALELEDELISYETDAEEERAAKPQAPAALPSASASDRADATVQPAPADERKEPLAAEASVQEQQAQSGPSRLAATGESVKSTSGSAADAKQAPAQEAGLAAADASPSPAPSPRKAAPSRRVHRRLTVLERRAFARLLKLSGYHGERPIPPVPPPLAAARPPSQTEAASGESAADEPDVVPSTFPGEAPAATSVLRADQHAAEAAGDAHSASSDPKSEQTASAAQPGAHTASPSRRKPDPRAEKLFTTLAASLLPTRDQRWLKSIAQDSWVDARTGEAHIAAEALTTPPPSPGAAARASDARLPTRLAAASAPTGAVPVPAIPFPEHWRKRPPTAAQLAKRAEARAARERKARADKVRAALLGGGSQRLLLAGATQGGAAQGRTRARGAALPLAKLGRAQHGASQRAAAQRRPLAPLSSPLRDAVLARAAKAQSPLAGSKGTSLWSKLVGSIGWGRKPPAAGDRASDAAAGASEQDAAVPASQPHRSIGAPLKSHSSPAATRQLNSSPARARAAASSPARRGKRRRIGFGSDDPSDGDGDDDGFAYDSADELFERARTARSGSARTPLEASRIGNTDEQPARRRGRGRGQPCKAPAAAADSVAETDDDDDESDRPQPPRRKAQARAPRKRHSLPEVREDATSADEEHGDADAQRRPQRARRGRTSMPVKPWWMVDLPQESPAAPVRGRKRTRTSSADEVSEEDAAEQSSASDEQEEDEEQEHKAGEQGVSDDDAGERALAAAETGDNTDAPIGPGARARVDAAKPVRRPMKPRSGLHTSAPLRSPQVERTPPQRAREAPRGSRGSTEEPLSAPRRKASPRKVLGGRLVTKRPQASPSPAADAAHEQSGAKRARVSFAGVDASPARTAVATPPPAASAAPAPVAPEPDEDDFDSLLPEPVLEFDPAPLAVPIHVPEPAWSPDAARAPPEWDQRTLLEFAMRPDAMALLHAIRHLADVSVSGNDSTTGAQLPQRELVAKLRAIGAILDGRPEEVMPNGSSSSEEPAPAAMPTPLASILIEGVRAKSPEVAKPVNPVEKPAPPKAPPAISSAARKRKPSEPAKPKSTPLPPPVSVPAPAPPTTPVARSPVRSPARLPQPTPNKIASPRPSSNKIASPRPSSVSPLKRATPTSAAKDGDSSAPRDKPRSRPSRTSALALYTDVPVAKAT